MKIATLTPKADTRLSMEFVMKSLLAMKAASGQTLKTSLKTPEILERILNPHPPRVALEA
ncbi:MAG: hypothetical protein P3X22_001195 [Thermoprotei archaeon]|nr:hypothetical protein [Thermoprotei archaeon]